MKQQAQFEAMAKWQGWNFNPDGIDNWVTKEKFAEKDGRYEFKHNLPNYLDANVLDDIVQGLDELMICEYHDCLCRVMGFCTVSKKVHQATPAQKLEALVRCLGLWEVL